MKNIILALVILVLGSGLLIENRYNIIVDSPVVAKVDTWTGDVWIVNSGEWMKVQPSISPVSVSKEGKEANAKTGGK